MNSSKGVLKNNNNTVITQIGQPQSSWGQDVQADGADKWRGQTISGGGQRSRGRRRRHTVALQT